MIERSDIVNKMSLREKEIFKKYEDTYPFSLRQFIEEVGIKVREHKVKKGEGLDACLTQDDEQYYINISIPKDDIYQDIKLSIVDKNFIICMILMSFYYDIAGSNLDDGRISYIRSCAFLMPREVFQKFVYNICKDNPTQSEENLMEETAEYFGVPVSAVGFYSNYLLDPNK